ncbi:MAG: SDR family NAD(P)-dependent oxidoreductase [Syntrophomonadaceae bacterium]|jgi:NAD(P)-dependent dehydrogenase (short-subunit alcohol dehydrogenase family)
MINPLDLSNKTILVTGASDGIGKATAILLSQLGAKVIMVARNEEKLQTVFEMLEGEGHRWYSYNLKEINGIEALIKKLVSENGAFDGFVHCAGVSSLRPLKMTSYDFLHNMMLINFYSFIEIVRCISKKGNHQPKMSIVGMSSVASIKGEKSQIAYCATKAAMDGAIRAMAKELSAKKIRVNSIVAGFINTGMLESFKEKTGSKENDSRFDRYCLGIGEPLDVANAIAFLLSDSSSIITGTGLVVDSGATT